MVNGISRIASAPACSAADANPRGRYVVKVRTIACSRRFKCRVGSNAPIKADLSTLYLLNCLGWFTGPTGVTVPVATGTVTVRVTPLIAELEQAGMFTIQRRGQGKTNLYTIHFQVKALGDNSRSKSPRGKPVYLKA